MQVGCYVLDLYCDSESHPGFNWKTDNIQDGKFPDQFTAEFGYECRKQAKEAGWKLFRNGNALCPRCAGERREVELERRKAAVGKAR